MKKNTVNWWNIIAKLRYDKSLWDYLEPAEITEIIQRIREAKQKIKGLERVMHIDLKPALRKMNSLRSHLHFSDLNVTLIH
jgi:hypothetical protein